MISPIQKLDDPLFLEKAVQIYIKRDDQTGGALHGNKFRKLKYHLLKAEKMGRRKLLTFGGAFSNHLYAIASIGFQKGWPTIGLMRGEIDEGNPTVKQLRAWNMTLVALDRNQYRHKDQPSFLLKIRKEYPDAYVIAEGGRHPLAMRGVHELVSEIRQQTDQQFDYWICPVGSGTTATGILQVLRPDEKMVAFSVLKGLNPLDTIAQLNQYSAHDLKNVLGIDASFGGFGKRNRQVEDFVIQFHRKHEIFLDPIYLGRTLLKLYQMLEEHQFPPSSKILIIHTGGLQGTQGYNYLYHTKLPAMQPIIG